MELPRLQPLYEKYNEQGFEVVAIERKQDTERAKKFIEENALTYTLLQNGIDDNEIVRELFGIRSFPTSFLIDREGKIMYFHLGFEEGDEDEIEEQLLTLL